MQALTIVVIALCLAHTIADLAPCKPEIVDSISDFWDDNEVPDGVMASLAKNGKGTLLYSTETVPVKVPLENPKCVQAVFTKTNAKFTVIPSDDDSLDAAKAVSFTTKEKNGVITEDKGRVAKYIILNDKASGVTAFYTCNPIGGDDDAADAAGVAVAIKKYKTKSTKKAVAAAKSTLEDLGFDLQTTYPKDCTK